MPSPLLWDVSNMEKRSPLAFDAPAVGMPSPLLLDTPNMGKRGPLLSDTPNIGKPSPLLLDTPNMGMPSPLLLDVPNMGRPSPIALDTPKHSPLALDVPDMAMQPEKVDVMFPEMYMTGAERRMHLASRPPMPISERKPTVLATTVVDLSARPRQPAKVQLANQLANLLAEEPANVPLVNHLVSLLAEVANKTGRDQGNEGATAMPKRPPRSEPRQTSTSITLIVRNIPLRYNLELLLEEWSSLDAGVDLMYLPYNKGGYSLRGYCIINFISEARAKAFKARWHRKLLELPGQRVRELVITNSKQQGYEATLRQIATSGFHGHVEDENKYLAVFSGNMRLDPRQELRRFRSSSSQAM